MKKIIAIIMTIVMLCGCSKQENVAEESDGSRFSFESQVAYRETEDGWLHYFIIETSKRPGNPTGYIYDAYNLKYDEVEGCVIEVMDEKTGVIESYMTTEVPYLTSDNEYDNDFSAVEEYFDNREPAEVIPESEFDELSLEKLDSRLVFELYNEAVSSEKLSDGEYYYLPEAHYADEYERDGYRWQVGFFGVHGELIYVNIELIYNDEIYLSDVICDGTASDEQAKLAELISDIEESMVEKQLFEIEDSIYDKAGEEYEEELKRLDKVLENEISKYRY